MPKVSVIVPVYNVEQYLERSMNCLLNQTLKDIEIICIDDCSTDNSLEILKKYEKLDSKFKIISLNKNQGAAIARNKGLEIADGEYLGFMDPDDAIDLNFYEELYKKAKEDNYDIVKGKRLLIKTDGKVVISTINNKIRQNKFEFYGEYTTAIYKKNIIDKNNIKFQNLPVGEDTLFLNNILTVSNTLSVIDNVCYYYHKRNGSLLDFSNNSFQKTLAFTYSTICKINNINNTNLFEQDIKRYNTYILNQIQINLNKYFSCNSEIKMIYALCIINIFLLHKDTNYLKEHFRFSLILKPLVNQDIKSLTKILNKYKNNDNLLLANTFIQNIFSVKNQKKGKIKYKVVTILGIKFKFKTKKFKKIYYYKNNNNFGDFLNLDLFKFFNYRIAWANKDKSEIMAIGSLLQWFIIPELSFKAKLKLLFSKPIIVYGSGFIRKKENEEYLLRKLDVRAVRGYLSLKRLNEMKYVKIAKNVAIGDPGLLVSKIFDTSNVEKIYDLGIIPHYIDKDSPYLKNIQVTNSIILDVNEKPKNLILKMAQCKNIISSAMHGLIAADSLGIPNMRMILSDNIIGGDYKFNDYYSAFGLQEHKKINLIEEKFTDKDLIKIKENYKIEKSKIEKIQQDLIKAFPYKRVKI